MALEPEMAHVSAMTATLSLPSTSVDAVCMNREREQAVYSTVQSQAMKSAAGRPHRHWPARQPLDQEENAGSTRVMHKEE
jgi:hypothetical protein